MSAVAKKQTAQIKLPPKLVPVFTAPRGSVRYRAAYGGRGSGKSFSFAKMAAIFGYAEPLRILCTRELQISIKESFHAELKNAIKSEPWLSAHYDVGEAYIKGCNGTEFLFRGLRHNMQSIKSLAQVDVCIVEEAEDVPEASWEELEPTIRAERSEIWVIWNPKRERSPVDVRFIKTPPDDALIAEMNYWDNPWFPEVLERQRVRDDQMMDPQKYAHIWEGQYLKNSDSQVFANKYRVEAFEPAANWEGPLQGLDFGFAADPTAASRMWVHDNRLFIEYEAGQVGLELDDTSAYLCSRIPGYADYVTWGDSARPESISYLQRHGLPRLRPVKKWPGSVEDGIQHMKSYKEIIVHPRCKEHKKEFDLYSHKTDRHTGEVLPAIIDAYNHYIDSDRYGLSGRIRTRDVIFEAL